MSARLITRPTGLLSLLFPRPPRSLAPSRALRAWLLAALAAVALMFLAPSVSDGQTTGKLELKTTAFRTSGNIPRQFTCEGANASPALTWSDPPAGTKSFALIVDDPDAPMGTFVHWVVYNLPPATHQLPEGVPAGGDLRGGGMQGMNDFPKTGYGGPCPPPGKPHRYFFRLYALDSLLTLKAGARRAEVDRAMKGHVLAQAELMGTFGR
jgi:hypothetical protein